MMILTETLIDLVKSHAENEWIEYKVDNTDPEKIGEYISALTNSVCLHKQPQAFVIWGVQNETRTIVGTTFNPANKKIGNESLESWLQRLLEPRVHFQFQTIQYEEKTLVVLEIQTTVHQPISFKGNRYIRIGSTTKNLQGYPAKEQLLWSHCQSSCFEEQVALGNVSLEQVLTYIDYESYFRLLGIPVPTENGLILEYLLQDGLLLKKSTHFFDITNMGAILLANDLKHFEQLRRKAVRVIIYKGNTKVETRREQQGNKGYASGFEGLIKFVNDQLPRNEIMGKALRKSISMYPELAIRELIANALIHQDFSISGTAPMIEIFESRLEIINPGQSIVEAERLLNLPPRSRNEKMASLLRRFGICEERGSGIEKVMTKIEEFQLPAPLIESKDSYTRVVLFSSRSFNEYSKEDLNRACYYHACLKYKHHESLTNASLRERLNIENAPQISRILNDAVEAQMIKIKDENVGKKARQYIPIWA
jgi:ATP-dependent DNA helicase RecG